MANPKPSIVPPTMTDSEVDEQINALYDADVGASLVQVLATQESPIAEGSPHHDRESEILVAESPFDPNTSASVHELPEPSPEKLVICSKKSAIPEEAPVVQTEAESKLELGEIPGSTTDKSATSLEKSPIVGMVQGAPNFKRKSRRGADLESAIIRYKSAIPEHESAI